MYRILIFILLMLYVPLSGWSQKNVAGDEHSGHVYRPENVELSSQEQQAKSSQYWLSGGIGPATGLAGAVVSLSYQRNAHLITTRYAMAGGFGGSVHDIGLLYGRAYSRKLGHASFAAGVGWVIVEYVDYYSSFYSFIGLPLELQLNWTPSKGFGLGITGFANLNKEGSFAGVAVTLQFGKLR